MFRIFIIYLLVLFTSQAMASEAVDRAFAQKIAINFANQYFANPNNLHFEHIGYPSSKSLSLHIFSSDQGFVIVSASQLVYPVMAWSDTSPFDTEKMPGPVKLWLNSMAATADYITQHYPEPSAPVKSAWDKLAHNIHPKSNLQDAVPPMLLTTWNQGCYYNAMLPIDTLAPSCSHVYTGCVATAMAQVMKYYNFPKTGTGSWGYNSNYGWIEADFENTTYQWAEMEMNLSAENPAVAQLMAHAAISVSSQFFYNGTGAYDFDARDALVDYFNYKPEAQFLWRSGYNGDWNALLKNELQSGRPVIYGGVEQSTQYGHTFVLDGYLEDFFHVNWGWGGQYNGYYLIDTLNPASFHFNFQHDAIVGIEPNMDIPSSLTGPANFNATVDQHTVELTWDAPTGNSLELLGYYLFRNDTLLNTSIETSTSFTDTNVPAGAHHYRVWAAFIGSGTGASALTEAYVSSINEAAGIELGLSPNPATHHVTLTFEQKQWLEMAQLVDLSGKVMLNIPLTPGAQHEIRFSVAPLPPGVYLLKITTDKFMVAKKLIKQNH